jgi:hypothetical protein
MAKRLYGYVVMELWMEELKGYTVMELCCYGTIANCYINQLVH